MRESKVFIFYDIEQNRTRNRVTEILKDYGLKHVQYSVCCGSLSPNKWEELFLKARSELGDEPGYIILLPVCDTDFKKIRNTGEPLGIKQVPVISFE